jgi:NOL1/NOP2/fmu family ribosome biogenesis protein
MRKIDETEQSKKNENIKTDIRLVQSNHKDIQPYLKYINEHFGIEKNILENFKFIFRGRDIYFVNKSWTDENIGLFTRIGLKFGTLDKKNRITFHSQAALALEKHITKFIYDLRDEEHLKNYLTGWKIKDTDIPDGQYVIRYNNWVLGTAIKNDEGLKSRFPRTKRTQKFEF